MAEINLLPDELREKEKKELESVRKKPKRFEIEVSRPQKEKVKLPFKVSPPSLLSRLFAKKVAVAPPLSELAESLAEKPEKSTKEGPVEKVLHLPPLSKPEKEETKLSSKELKPSFLSRLFTKKTKTIKPVATSLKPVAEKITQEGPADEIPAYKEKELEIKWPEEKTRIDLKERVGEKERGKKYKRAEKESTLDVNLIPAELAEHPELELPQRLLTSGVVIFISILVASGFYLGISWYQYKIIRQIETLEVKIADLNEQISQAEKEKAAALELQEHLVLIRQLLDNHVYWTKFFGLLEKYTVKDVYYTNFSMAGREQLVISAVGKNYQSVAKQLVAFQQASDFVKSVKIDAASAKIDELSGTYQVNFNINLEFLPQVFLRPINSFGD